MASPFDWLTLNEAKSTLNISASDTTQDDLLDIAVSALSERLDRGAGLAVERTVEDETHSGGYSNGKSKIKIRLNHRPVKEIISVVEYQDGKSVTLTEQKADIIPAEGFTQGKTIWAPEYGDGILTRKTAGYTSYFWGQESNIVVTYTAGRFPDTEAVAARFKLACQVSLKSWWRMYEHSIGQVNEFDQPQQNFPAFAIPYAACEILGNDWVKEVGFGA